MAQGQQSAVDEAPDTLPSDFFDKQNSAPDTLPGNFFEKQKPTQPDSLLQATKRAAITSGASPQSTQPATPTVTPTPTGPVSRFAAGAMDALKAFKPQMPDKTDMALAGLGPLGPMSRHAIQAYRSARASGEPVGESVAEGAGGLVGVNSPGVRERAQHGDIAGVLGEGAVPIATTLAAEPSARMLGAAREAIRPVQQRMAENVLAPTVFEGGAEAGADVRQGISPKRALASEPDMVGSSNKLLGTSEAPGKIPQRVAELKDAANQILENHPNSIRQVDAGAHIDAAIDKAVSKAEKVAGATARLEELREALKTKYGPVQGTPREMNDLATAIQREAKELGAYKNTQPVEASAGAAMSDVARRIRTNVNDLVPEAKQLNQRMADLLDAQSGVAHRANAEAGRSVLGDNMRGVTSSIANKVAGGPFMRTALAKLLNAGNRLEVPAPIAQRAMPQIRGLLGTGPRITPPPADTSGPVNLGQPRVEPLAENRQLPPVGRTSGPRNEARPGQFPIPAAETTRRPLTGPERQLPEIASPSNTSLPMERGGRGPNQIPPNLTAPESPLFTKEDVGWLQQILNDPGASAQEKRQAEQLMGIADKAMQRLRKRP